jgi:predicted ArsR family transcriptional regulator
MGKVLGKILGERCKLGGPMNEKILSYLRGHHQVQATTLARAMIISKSKASSVLEDLVKAGLAERVDKKFYKARSQNATEAR